jgi:hypothetical protein
MFEFEFGTVSFCFSFIFVLFGESRLLVSWYAGDRCGIRAAMRIVAGVRHLVQRTEDGRTGRILGDWVIKRSDGTVCSLHRAHGDE